MSSTRPVLPSWDTIPDDLPVATVQVKQALRASIEASGRSIDDVIAEVEAFLVAEIADIDATRARGEEVWPVVVDNQRTAAQVAEARLSHTLHHSGKGSKW